MHSLKPTCLPPERFRRRARYSRRLAGELNAPESGFRASGELDLDGLDCRLSSLVGEPGGVKVSCRSPASEIPCPDLRDEVGAASADAAFAGVVSKPAFSCAERQRSDCLSAESDEAHARNIEQRGRIGLRTLLLADEDPGLGDEWVLWIHRM